MNKILYDLLLQAAEYENNTSSPRATQDLAVYDLLVGSALQLQAQDDGDTSDCYTNNMMDVAQSERLQTKEAAALQQQFLESLLELAEQDSNKKVENLDGASSNFNPLQEAIRRITEQAKVQVDANPSGIVLKTHGYDMVVSLTLGSVNATLKQFLKKMKRQATTKYYVRRKLSDGKSIVEEANATESATLESLQLFKIPTQVAKRTTEQTRAIGEARNLKLKCAFRANFGFPEQITPKSDDLIVDFADGVTGNLATVDYKLTFSEFAIVQVEIDEDDNSTIFTKIEQSADKPWRFLFHVNLGLVGVPLEKLPETVRKQVNNIDPGNMFGVQQLFLDLNTTKLQDQPMIEGISDDAQMMEKTFMKYYFEELRKNGDVIFAYAVVPKPETGKLPYLMQPADFRFYVAPYLENGKANLAKKHLYTLNYLVLCSKRDFPPITPFAQNWVAEGEYGTKSGVMAFRSSKMLDIAIAEYKKLMKYLVYKTDNYVNVSSYKVSLRASITRDNEVTPEFDENGNYNYCSRAYNRDSGGVFKEFVADMTLQFTNGSRVKCYQSTDGRAIMECVSDLVCYLRLDVGGGSSRGNIYNQTLYYTLELSVDTYGKLQCKPSFTQKDNGTNFEYNNWSKSLMDSSFENNINNMKANIVNFVSEAKTQASTQFMNRYNNQVLWMLPGDKSFSFKNPRFTNAGDMQVDVSYTTPNV